MGKKGGLKWSPAYPIVKQDKIISSDSRMQGDVFGFIPSYEFEPKVNMCFIMSNEYYRMWFKERGKYDKDNYAAAELLKEEARIKRRFVQRDLRRKAKIKPLPILKLARFQNIVSKVDCQREKKKKKEKRDELDVL